jgi:hypothetical protein
MPVGIQGFDSLDYYELLGGDIALLPEDDPASPVIDQTRWMQLINQQRSRGLASLTRQEQLIVLSGAAKAYLTLVRSASYEYRIQDQRAQVQEIYRLDEETKLLIDLAERAAVFDDLEVEWSGVVTAMDSARAESREFFDESLPSPPYGERWSRVGDQWSCSLEQSNDGYHISRAIYFGRISDMALSSAEGLAKFERHPVEVATRDVSGLQRTFYLEPTSLWPIAFDEQVTLVDGSAATLSSKVLSLNTELSIELPDESCYTVASRGHQRNPAPSALLRARS